MRKVFVILSIAIAALLSTSVFANVNDDQVTSQKIREADGTSGQDTNTGGGVKTGHIQDGAVTDAKIGGVIKVDKLATYVGMKIVHAGPVNGVDTFNTINDALNAIATPDQQTVIKIMPGTYSAPDLSIANVIFEGSGRENTVLQGSASGGGGSKPAVFRGLTIDNIDSYASITLDNAVCISGMILRYEGVVNPSEAIHIKDSVAGWVESRARTNIVNSVIDSISIYGHADIRNSIINRFAILNGESYKDSMITDTVVGVGAAPGTSGYAIGIFNWGASSGQTTLVNVRTMNVKTGLSVSSGVAVSVRGSNFEGTQFGVETGGSSIISLKDCTVKSTEHAIMINPNGFTPTVHVTNSQLIGTPVYNTTPVNVRLFNCYDGNINAIPNM